jgi:putative nucleotidyltransferase with HDIG domain
MFDFLKRQKLQRQGYSCGKKRREGTCGEWVEILRTSTYVRGLILAAFLFALGTLTRYLPQEAAVHSLPHGLGMAAMLTLLILSMAQFRVNMRSDYARNSRFLLVYGIMLLHLALLAGVWKVAEINHLEGIYLLLLAPAALAPMTLTVLLGKRHGEFATVYVTLWGALLADYSHALQFAIVNAFAGLIGSWSVRKLRKRSQLLRAGLYAGLAPYGALVLLQISGGAFTREWHTLAMDCGVSIAAGLFTAMLVGGMLPLIEAVFRVTTTVSWLELADLNHPLLRRMTLEAPGTYHHSLMVANLSEAAAEAVGANATVCRVCSYFHDIGKLVKPDYYIENMGGEENPHDELAPSMSALVVIAHVKDGVDLALRHKLNREVIDVIQQHHGTSLITYFYRRALDQQEEIKKAVAEGKASESDVPEVKESSFRYPGPRPCFRESAIISLADAVESASRTLTKPTPQKIEALVDDIIRSRLRDGQLDECDLTLRDLHLVRDTFTKTLRTSLHRRIPYPDEKVERKDDARSATERLEERYATEVYERPRRAGKSGRPSTDTTQVPTATNIIPMPATPPDEKTRQGK